MIFSLVAMIGLEKCCITSACVQWLCHSGERTVAMGLLFINMQVVTFSGPPFQVAGLLYPWQISHQISKFVFHEGR